LPRRLLASELTLATVGRDAQFVFLTYQVTRRDGQRPVMPGGGCLATALPATLARETWRTDGAAGRTRRPGASGVLNGVAATSATNSYSPTYWAGASAEDQTGVRGI